MGRFCWGLLALVLSLSVGCGLPVNQLTAKERKADMQWAFSVFEHNYAPVQLKKSNYGVELSEVQTSCMTLAEEEMDNQAFLALFQKCIKDAHVGAQQMNTGVLPEYAKVAHLGFLTMRTKAMVDGQKSDALRLVAPFKGSDGSGAPLVPGDLIIRVNDQSVGDYLREEVVPYIDAGQDETNLTQAAFRFGLRSSIDMALPLEDELKLVVARGPMIFTIVLPWIKEDYLAFQLKQNPPEKNQEPLEVPGLTKAELEMETVEDLLSSPQLGERPDGVFGLAEHPLAHVFLGYEDIKGILSQFDTPVEFVTNRLKAIALNGFQLMKFNPLMQALFSGEFSARGELEKAMALRTLPHSEKVDDLMADPIFKAKAVLTQSGDTYAYLQIKNFPADDKILMEWFRAMTAIEDKGIKKVIIDMIDNGGGSLVHGMRMLNMLRQKSLQYPQIQVRLNNNWVNSFKSQAAFSESDYQKAIASRVVEQMTEDQEAGKILSRPISVTVMDPFFLQNPNVGLPDDVKVTLLVNEMCVSMCDIFASVFQNNQMGIVIGQRTMGGGGNVAQHGLSPISKLGLALTESLILDKGKHIEDEGVTPDILVDMVGDREKGFSNAFMKALEAMSDSN